MIASTSSASMAWGGAAMADKSIGPEGIGGWLAAMLVLLGIIEPLYFLVAAYYRLGELAAYYDYYDTPVPWVAHAAVWASAAVKIAVALAIVWRMVRVRRTGTIRFAIVGIWMFSIGTVFVDIGLSALAGMLPFSSITFLAVMFVLTIGLVHAVPLTYYLLRSKRVANTYLSPEESVAALEQTFD